MLSSSFVIVENGVRYCYGRAQALLTRFEIVDCLQTDEKKVCSSAIWNYTRDVLGAFKLGQNVDLACVENEF